MYISRSLINLTLLSITMTAGCQQDLRVPASDTTPPSAVWLQIDRPGQPLLNADLSRADPPSHAAAGQQMQLTARADDPDGGVQDVQIWVTEQTWRTNPDGTVTTSGPGLAGAPSASNPSQAAVGDVAPASSSVKYSTTPAAGTSVRRQYVFWARAVNFHNGTAETKQLTVDVP